MLTYPISFLNAGGQYSEAIGRRYVHHSVMDKYRDQFQRSLEVRQAEDYIEFRVCYDPLPRVAGGEVAFPVRVNINQFRWAMNTLRTAEGSIWQGFEGLDGGVIDFETGLGHDGHTLVTNSFGEENEDFDDSMKVALSSEDWHDLLRLIDEMIADFDEWEAKRVETTLTWAEWCFVVKYLTDLEYEWEADEVRTALNAASYTHRFDENDPVTLAFQSDGPLEAIQMASKPALSFTFPEWLRIADEAMRIGYRLTALDILHQLAWHEYGKNDTADVELRFDIPIYHEVCGVERVVSLLAA